MKYNYKRLKAIREIRGLIQEQVADVLGLTRTGYQAIEDGTNKLTIPNLEKLVTFYNEMESFCHFTTISADYFFEGDQIEGEKGGLSMEGHFWLEQFVSVTNRNITMLEERVYRLENTLHPQQEARNSQEKKPEK